MTKDKNSFAIRQFWTFLVNGITSFVQWSTVYTRINRLVPWEQLKMHNDFPIPPNWRYNLPLTKLRFWSALDSSRLLRDLLRSILPQVIHFSSPVITYFKNGSSLFNDASKANFSLESSECFKSEAHMIMRLTSLCVQSGVQRIAISSTFLFKLFTRDEVSLKLYVKILFAERESSKYQK